MAGSNCALDRQREKQKEKEREREIERERKRKRERERERGTERGRRKVEDGMDDKTRAVIITFSISVCLPSMCVTASLPSPPLQAYLT